MIIKYFPLIEKVLLTMLGIGLVLMLADMGSTVARFSLIGLAIAFFLMANRPAETSIEEGRPPRFLELLGLSIVPKVLWIGSAICAMGISFYLFDFGNDGYIQMLVIGTLSVVTCLLIIMICAVADVKMSTVIPILLRAVPLSLVSAYLWLQWSTL